MSESTLFTRRSFLRVAGGATALAALAACTPAAAPSGEGGAAQDVSISFWMWNTYAPEADDILEQGILAWGEENGMNIEISRDSDSDMASQAHAGAGSWHPCLMHSSPTLRGRHGHGSGRLGRHHRSLGPDR